MPLHAIARLIQTMLYAKRFFPYYVYNILGGIEEDGQYYSSLAFISLSTRPCASSIHFGFTASVDVPYPRSFIGARSQNLDVSSPSLHTHNQRQNLHTYSYYLPIQNPPEPTQSHTAFHYIVSAYHTIFLFMFYSLSLVRDPMFRFHHSLLRSASVMSSSLIQRPIMTTSPLLFLAIDVSCFVSLFLAIRLLPILVTFHVPLHPAGQILVPSRPLSNSTSTSLITLFPQFSSFTY